MYKTVTKLNKGYRPSFNLNSIKVQKRFETQSATHGLNLEKKNGSMFLKSLGFITLVSAGYGGTVYYANHNQEFQKQYLEYAPYGQESLTLMKQLEDKVKSDDFQPLKTVSENVNKIVESVKSSVNGLMNNSDTVATPTHAISNVPVTKDKEPQVKVLVKEKLPEIKHSKPTMDEKSLRQLQQLASQLTKLTYEDQVMKELVESIDNYISTNGDKKVTVEESVLAYSKVLYSLKNLTPYLDESIKNRSTLNKDLERSNVIVEDMLTQQKKELEEKYELEMKDKYQLYESEREKLMDRFKAQLDEKLQEQGKTLERFWRRESKLLVDSERNGRLSKLDQVIQQVMLLEDGFINSKQNASNQINYQKLSCAIDALETAIKEKNNSPFIEELRYIQSISQCTPLVAEVINSLDELVAMRGLLNFNSLKQRFEKVSEEVSSSALVKENAGFFGHLSSYILTTFLFNKQGLVEGNDVEAVIARCQYYLNQNDLDLAARELNQLKGWPKKLAEDWILEAKNRLEFEQAVEVLKTELRSIHLSVL
ncbi:hypothetical protein K502DRAFT_367268 [Neoconidiobolus thromboides FSU 785]|nr:hypothetical protein K502DRAFT_367268 [Neoconidiobolus thromboides FSU 785]